jgi:hypothetical protein
MTALAPAGAQPTKGRQTGLAQGDPLPHVRLRQVVGPPATAGRGSEGKQREQSEKKCPSHADQDGALLVAHCVGSVFLLIARMLSLSSRGSSEAVRAQNAQAGPERIRRPSSSACTGSQRLKRSPQGRTPRAIRNQPTGSRSLDMNAFSGPGRSAVTEVSSGLRGEASTLTSAKPASASSRRSARRG